MNGRVIDQPRGKVLGGSSCLNAMVYIRGHAEDYERWGEQLKGEEGGLDWSYGGCLPYVRFTEPEALHSGTIAHPVAGTSRRPRRRTRRSGRSRSTSTRASTGRWTSRPAPSCPGGTRPGAWQEAPSSTRSWRPARTPATGRRTTSMGEPHEHRWHRINLDSTSASEFLGARALGGAT
jgi:choline dehydrogenase-like flavoprotein